MGRSLPVRFQRQQPEKLTLALSARREPADRARADVEDDYPVVTAMWRVARSRSESRLLALRLEDAADATPVLFLVHLPDSMNLERFEILFERRGSPLRFRTESTSALADHPSGCRAGRPPFIRLRPSQFEFEKRGN